jgi:hypothetical protein
MQRPTVNDMRRKARPSTGKSKRGRKPIFTEAQKRVLQRMISDSLKNQLRALAKIL